MADNSLERKLYPFQYMGAYKLFTESRFLLADDMGMFKTSQAILASNKFRQKNKRLRTLIICPASVREHWAREIGRWGHPAEEISVLRAGTFDSDLSKARRSRWAITHYGLAGDLPGSASKKLTDLGFQHLILDEVHNAKNPYALRTQAVKKLADQADHLSMLSGTPIPNSIADLYTMMSLLDPVRYPLDLENVQGAWNAFIELYFDKPQCVKTLFHQKMLHRRAEDYLDSKLPEAEFHRIELPLTGNHLDVYQSILHQNLHAGQKIMLMEKASIDPRLVESRKRLNKDSSVKYRFLDDIVERETHRKGGKVLIFTHLKEGIVNHLLERYADKGALAVTGDVSLENGIRDNIRKRFQEDPRCKVMIATTTMNEGVDLTAATVVVNLTIPWTPAEYQQRYKRSHRVGEIKKEKVDIYTPFTTINGPQPSLEQAALKMLDGKQHVVSYLMSGLQVSYEELKEYEGGARSPTISRATTSPNKAVLKYFVPWRAIGSERALARLGKNPELDNFIAQLYAPSGKFSEFSMARNAAQIYMPIIEKLEKKKRMPTKLDLACGPGMLGFYLQEPTIGIDISPAMIREGKKLFPQNNLMQGKMHELPLKSESVDFTLCSLAFQMAGPKEERAKTLQEMSRVLKPNGYALMIFVGNYLSETNREKLETAFDVYGLNPVKSAVDVGPSKVEWYLLQKNHDPSTQIMNLRFKGDGGR